MSGSDGGGSWMSGVFDAAQDAVGDIVTELESFTKFQQRIDQLIKDLHSSPASAKQVGQDQPARHTFGGGEASWGSANRLSTAHDTVIQHLEALSKILSDSIEGMGIAVMSSHKGYANVDADIRDRMLASNAETKKHFGGGYDPFTDSKTQPGEGTTGTSSGTTSHDTSGAPGTAPSTQPEVPTGNETTGAI
ncbi:hypothetical protein AB0J38_05220 [Streptomyces sp. NPDC050095]|uniref:hypothetical protein n=1 Tax=unclassified Streptomyces TaxID=2593676 RepID=UPI0034343711